MELHFEFPQETKDSKLEKMLKGYKCSCCGLFIKAYKRTFNSNMAVACIFLYRNRQRGFIQVEKEMGKAMFERCGDFSYLRHYNLIEPMKSKREDGCSRNGFYKITGLGIMFCERKTKVQEKFIIFNNKILGFDGKEIDIKDALDVKFNYDELMRE